MSVSKYMPHQGAKEIARRLAQAARLEKKNAIRKPVKKERAVSPAASGGADKTGGEDEDAA